VDNVVNNTATTLLSANYIYGFIYLLILRAYKYTNKNNILKIIAKSLLKTHRRLWFNNWLCTTRQLSSIFQQSRADSTKLGNPLYGKPDVAIIQRNLPHDSTWHIGNQKTTLAFQISVVPSVSSLFPSGG
jgi:hypothetical protein